MPTYYVIRTKWHRGEKSAKQPLLYNQNAITFDILGLMLGFVGIRPSRMTGIRWPSQYANTHLARSEFFPRPMDWMVTKAHSDHEDTIELAFINDDPLMTDEEREKRIIRIVKGHGVGLRFSDSLGGMAEPRQESVWGTWPSNAPTFTEAGNSANSDVVRPATSADRRAWQRAEQQEREARRAASRAVPVQGTSTDDVTRPLSSYLQQVGRSSRTGRISSAAPIPVESAIPERPTEVRYRLNTAGSGWEAFSVPDGPAGIDIETRPQPNPTFEVGNVTIDEILERRMARMEAEATMADILREPRSNEPDNDL